MASFEPEHYEGRAIPQNGKEIVMTEERARLIGVDGIAVWCWAEEEYADDGAGGFEHVGCTGWWGYDDPEPIFRKGTAACDAQGRTKVFSSVSEALDAAEEAAQQALR